MWLFGRWLCCDPITETSSPAETSGDFDRAALEAKVEAKLEALNAADPEFKEDELVVEEDEASPVEASDEKPEETSDEAEESIEEAPQEAAVKEPVPKSAPPTPTLPDAHRRSLTAYGWTDQDIDNSLATLGSKFLETAAKIHINRNDELQRWAQAGRAAKQPAGTTPPVPGQAPGAAALVPVDLAKLKAEHGDDPLFDAVLAPVNALIETVNHILPALQAGQAAAEKARVDDVGKTVESFFGDKPLQPFVDLYGDPGKGLTNEQFASRSRVLELAHDLIVGAAQARGEQLSLRDALTFAHDLVTKDRQEKVVRDQLTQKIQKRQRSIVTRPSAGKQALATGRAKTRAEAEERIGAKMREVFQNT